MLVLGGQGLTAGDTYLAAGCGSTALMVRVGYLVYRVLLREIDVIEQIHRIVRVYLTVAVKVGT